MYEAVSAYPDGTSTVSRYARTAARYGYDGLVVRSRGGDYDPDAIAETYEIDVVSGIEIDAETPQQAAGSIGNFRPRCSVLMVRGGSDELNRFCVETDRVDVLTRPMATGGDINHVLARAAKTNRVFIEFDLGSVLREHGGNRVKAIRTLRKLRELVEHYDAPFVVSANATSHFELRAPREPCALGEQIGFSAAQIRSGLRAWREIAARNRRRASDAYIEPGVRLGRTGDAETAGCDHADETLDPSGEQSQ